MNPQHLSDEAVAAFADGVLSGLARDRATRHINVCAECHQAVNVQREAAWALRAAATPSLPTGLFERLQTVPMTTPIAAPPTVLAPDGSTMLATFAPMAAFAPAPKRAGRRPIVTTAAMVAVAGALAAGAIAGDGAVHPPVGGTGHVVGNTTPALEVAHVFRNAMP